LFAILSTVRRLRWRELHRPEQPTIPKQVGTNLVHLAGLKVQGLGFDYLLSLLLLLLE
jgi:hypothetical protein